MRRKTWLLAAGLVVLLAAAAVLHAETLFYSLSATTTSKTQRFSRVVSSVLIINDSDSANKAYFRLFSDADAVGATTNAYSRLEVGDKVTFYFDRTGHQQGSGYLTITYLSAGTSTIRVYAE
jgi:hypothetical protein